MLFLSHGFTIYARKEVKLVILWPDSLNLSILTLTLTVKRLWQTNKSGCVEETLRSLPEEAEMSRAAWKRLNLCTDERHLPPAEPPSICAVCSRFLAFLDSHLLLLWWALVLQLYFCHFCSSKKFKARQWWRTP